MDVNQLFPWFSTRSDREGSLIAEGRVNNRELKMETFSGRRRPEWQRKPGTEAAVASRQKSNIKIAVKSEGRRL